MDDVGGALLTYILESKVPCCLEELCNLTGLRKFPRNTIEASLTDLCNIGIVAQVQGSRYVSAEIKDKWSGAGAQRPSQRRAESMPDRTSYRADEALVPGAEAGPQSAPVVPTDPWSHSPFPARPHQPPPASVTSQALVQRNTRQQVTTTNQSHDCDDQVHAYTEKLQKIMSVILPGDSPVKASKIAQLSGYGDARKDVNRELYTLQERGFLANVSGSSWTLVKAASEDELRVVAAGLAKKPASRRSSDGQMVRGPQGSSQQQDTSDHPCPNKGPQCHHYHLHQTNHYHQTNVQVGDNNNFFYGRDDEVRSKREK